MRKVRLPHLPSAEALTFGEALVDRSNRDRAPVRRHFIRRPEDDASAEPPPLAALLRGGLGGAVRVKLYLSMLLVASNPPYDTRYPANAWAQLLDLADPETNGARRITDAIHALSRLNLIRVEARRGRPTVAILLREDGSEEAYSVPGREAKEDEELPPEHWYVNVPAELWSRQWISTLSAPAVAMLLVLQDLWEPNRPDKWLFLSPDKRRKRYALSDDTWRGGLRELELLGLIESKRQPIQENVFDWRRMRKTYRLILSAFGEPLTQQRLRHFKQLSS